MAQSGESAVAVEKIEIDVLPGLKSGASAPMENLCGTIESETQRGLRANRTVCPAPHDRAQSNPKLRGDCELT